MNRKGFSLIELMVVVGIIAILSMIAIPSYKGFKAKARQGEGFGLLNEYYTKAQAARLEWGRYPGNFVQTGFAPRGTLNYRLEAADNVNDISMRKNDDLCVSTASICNCSTGPVPCPEYKIWDEAPAGAVGGVIGPSPVSPTTPPCQALLTQDERFVAGVAAWISGSAANPDKYTINEMKVLTMCLDGLK